MEERFQKEDKWYEVGILFLRIAMGGLLTILRTILLGI